MGTKRARGSRPLSARERLFAHEYIKDHNGARAARDAGYAESSAKVTAARLLTRANVAELVARLEEKALARAGSKADEVLQELHNLGLARLTRTLGPDGSPLPLDQWPEAEKAALTKLEVREILADRVMADTGETRTVVIGRIHKTRMDSKLGALNTLAEHHGLVKPKDGGNVQMRLEELILLARKSLELERGAGGER